MKANKVIRESLENTIKGDVKWEKICPRCGEPIIGYPALSRYADVNICSGCGTDEALLDWVGEPKKYEDWYAVKGGMGDTYGG